MPRIDFDANATTPLLPAVFEAMRPWLTTSFGNPSSSHAAGQRSRAAVERARVQMAALLNAEPREITFTSGGTESNNQALFSVIEPLLREGSQNALPPHLITMSTEHHAVLYPAEELARRGAAVTFVAPLRNGFIDVGAFESALTPATRMVSVMLANNETGVVQPIGKLARMAREVAAAHGTRIVVHTDAVQAASKLPIDLTGELRNVDLLSLSGHKMYAPQGTGVLFVRRGLQLGAMLHGGPQERARRAGTENVAGIVALGEAAVQAEAWFAEGGAAQLRALTQQLESGLLTRIPGAVVNAADAPRSPNTINLRVPGVDAERLLMALDLRGVAASYGSACMSGATEPSHVLTAMGLSATDARSSLRVSLSRLTTQDEVTRALDIVAATVAKLREHRA